VLTRKDGKEFTLWPTLQDDYIIFEPWFFFDYGPRVNGEGFNNTSAFLSIFGLKKWPDKVYQAHGME
jgi:hypothetical protein